MKHKIIHLICLICLSLVISSCDTTYYGVSSNPQCDDQEVFDNNVSYNIIIRYGTPYYYNGYLNYYFYEGLYYYPIYYNNYWYFRTFRQPFRYGYILDNRHWRPRPYMRGLPEYFGKTYRYNSYDRRLFYRNNPSRLPNSTHNEQNRSFGSLSPSKSNVNIPRRNRPNGTFGNGNRSGISGIRKFGGRR